MRYTYKILLAVVAVACFLTACNLDVNDDPNRATDKTITGELLFVGGAVETGQRIASENFTFLNNWLGYWSGSGTFAIDATETEYNITPAFGNTLWQNYYNTLFDLKLAHDKSLAAGDTVIAGASMILSARLWQDLVDIYNDIPYSQAFQYLKYPQPQYDKGQDIYNDLQSKLDQAIVYMRAKPLSNYLSYDIVNGRGVKADAATAKWIRFANTLKLKLLLHQSEIPGFDPTAEVAKIKANGGVLGRGETVSVNPGFSKQTNKQSPFYDNYGLTVNNADAAPSVRANVYFLDLLEDDGDIRETRYFTDVSGKYIGTTYGLTAGNPAAASGVGGPGMASSPSQDAWILTAVEALFLKAEALQRGWDIDPNGGTAAQAYNDAITESFVFLGVPDAETEAADYLSNYPYTGDIKDLIYQKYKSLAGLDPVEVWSDLRRLGFDIIPIQTPEGDSYITANPGTLSTTEIPSRLLYPQNEYTTNAGNANKEGTIDQFKSKIFWDVN